MALTDKLSAIGDAIRAKTGETGLLRLDEMPTAIAGIQTGGGEGEDLFAEYLKGTLKEVRIPDGVTKLPPHFFSGDKTITKVDLNDVTTLQDNNFFGCSNLVECDTSKVKYFYSGNIFASSGLKTLDLASAVNIGNDSNLYDRTFQNAKFQEVKNFKPTKLHNYIFYGCDRLRTIDLSELLETGSSSFYSCNGLKDIILPKIQKIGNSCFQTSSYNSSIYRTIIDIGADCKSIGSEAFKNNGYVTTVIVRAVTPPTLANANAFMGIFNSVNTNVAHLERHIYVPRDSLETYWNATNWTTFVGNGTIYRAIEDYPEITGG